MCCFCQMVVEALKEFSIITIQSRESVKNEHTPLRAVHVAGTLLTLFITRLRLQKIRTKSQFRNKLFT